MSINKIKSINVDNLQEFEKEWNTVQEGEIVALKTSKYETIENSLERIFEVFAYDPQITFVGTDFEVLEGDMVGYQTRSFNDVSDAPFFVKKMNSLQITVDEKLGILGSIAISSLKSVNDSKFEHIADPYFRLQV